MKQRYAHGVFIFALLTFSNMVVAQKKNSSSIVGPHNGGGRLPAVEIATDETSNSRYEDKVGATDVPKMSTPPSHFYLSEAQSSGLGLHMAKHKFESSGFGADPAGAGPTKEFESYTGAIYCTITKLDGKFDSEKCFVAPVSKPQCPGGPHSR